MITQRECDNAKERLRYYNKKFKNCFSIETFPEISIELYQKHLKTIVDYRKQILTILSQIKEQVLLKDIVEEPLYTNNKLYIYDTLIAGFNYAFSNVAPQNTRLKKIDNENDLKKEIEKRKNIRNSIMASLVFHSFESFLPNRLYCYFKEEFKLNEYDKTFEHIKKVYLEKLPTFRKMIRKINVKYKKEFERKKYEFERKKLIQQESAIAFEEILKRVESRIEKPCLYVNKNKKK